ncbi:MAG: outer membrane protein assembly factor BamE [bacterium]|nr:outer membrane protein assembly factor BamE [bacterium]
MGRSFVRRCAAAAVLGVGLSAVSGCEATRPEIVLGHYFLQYTLATVDGVHRTTNFRNGALVPINTEVELRESGSDRLLLRTKDGRDLVIENASRQTGGRLLDAFLQVLGRDPVDLSGYEPGVRYAIRVGQVLPGMTRKAVLAAIGPPPQTGTVSLEQTAWKYWKTADTTAPDNTFHVRFDRDGRVLEVR